DEAVQQRELKLLIGHLEEFVARVQQNLASADWMMKREIIRALVRRVEIDKQEVTVVFRVGPDPSGLIPKMKSSQHCWRRVNPTLWCPGFGGIAAALFQIPGLEPLGQDVF